MWQRIHGGLRRPCGSSMREDVKRQLTKSATAFSDIIWPIVGPLIGDGKLIRVESVTDGEFTNELDAMAGIDAWQVIQDIGIRGIASRVQPSGLKQNGKTYETFTVRAAVRSGADTEYHKRLRAIENPDWGLLCPHLTIHSYVSEDWKRALAIAAIRTKDLISFIRDNMDKVWETQVEGGNRMYAIKWSELCKAQILPTVWRYDELLFEDPPVDKFAVVPIF
jgi:hypothetical protein